MALSMRVCVLLLLLVDSLESKKLGRSCFLSSLPLASSWFGNPRRRRSRRRSPIQVCNDVVKEIPGEAVQLCNPTTMTRTSFKTVTKFKKGKRNVTRYENATRVVTKATEVEYKLPLEDFWLKAKEEIIQAIQEDLREGRIRAPPAGTGSRSPFCGDSEAHALILFGPSQSTKSTMVCQLRKSMLEKCPAVGDGSGESVTEWPELFDSILGPLLDTPGCFDTKLRFTSQEAAQRVAVAVAEANTRCLKFLVFDSMASDTMRLRDTLLTLFTVFGVQIRSSIVVIASRPNVKSPLEDAKRLELVRKTLEEQELNELVVWNISREMRDFSVPLVEAASGSEHFLLDKLKNSLQRLPSVGLSELDDLWNQTYRRAQELCDQQIPRTKEVFVDLNESYVRNFTEEEPYEIPYTEEVPYEEKYEGSKCELKNTKKSIVVKECRLQSS